MGVESIRKRSSNVKDGKSSHGPLGMKRGNEENKCEKGLGRWTGRHTTTAAVWKHEGIPDT
jgi:hypothetical protein